MLLLPICQVPAQANPDYETPITIRKKIETTTRQPRTPARIPVVCSHDEYSVFVESRYSLFANISIEDEAGTTVASTTAMLTSGQPLRHLNQPTRLIRNHRQRFTIAANFVYFYTNQNN